MDYLENLDFLDCLDKKENLAYREEVGFVVIYLSTSS